MSKLRVFSIAIAFSLFFTSLAIAEETLTWIECIEQARKNNPELISAKEVLNQQVAGKEITSSSLYPQISGNAGVSKTKTSGTTTDSYSYGLAGTQLLFNGAKTSNDVQAASENIKASQQNYLFTSTEVRLNLRTAFINLLKVQDLVSVAEEIYKIRRGSLELITLRYQSGLEHKGALLTAEANLAEAGFELAQAKREVALYQRQLVKEMGYKEFKPISVKEEFVIRDSVKVKPDFEALIKNNPSLLQAVAKKNAAAFSLKSAYANFFPEISADAGTGKRGSSWPAQNDQWNLGLTLTMPLFEGGLKSAQVNQARALYNQKIADEKITNDTVLVLLEQTWATLQDSIEIVDVRLKSLNAANERSKIAEAQYSTGFITFDNWIIIENDLVSAKKAYLNSQADALFAEAGWIQAKGETLEYAQ